MKPLAIATIAFALVSGIAGGLARAGVVAASNPWLGQAAVFHAALMMGGFFGTVIGIERAVAAKRRYMWLSPLASAAAAIAIVAGAQSLSAWLLLFASAVFFAGGVMLWRRERAMHTFVLAAAAACWLAGNALFASGFATPAVLPWWFLFLIVTIAAERLEMARLMRPKPLARAAFVGVLAALAAGASLSAVLFGVGLVALAAWLFAFDIARRTIRAPGLPRYMAVCLLTGYAWLAIGGVSWVLGLRDASLHALGLGFIVSMVMAHAPVILPAVSGISLRFTPAFYLPLALLHASLAWRLAGNLGSGASANAAAIALFGATVVLSVRRKQKGHPAGGLPAR